MKLHNPTDDQLDAAFAEHVAKMEKDTEGLYLISRDKDGNTFWGGPDCLFFTRSADAVLPWLEKWQHCPISWLRDRAAPGDQWEVKIYDKAHDGGFLGHAPTFSRAAVIALLRAHGVEATFD